MKATKLIEELQKMIDQHGDADVGRRHYDADLCIPDPEGGYDDIDRIVPAYAWKAGQPFVDDIEGGVAFFEFR